MDSLGVYLRQMGTGTEDTLQPPLSPVPLQGAGAWVPGDIPEDIPGGYSQLQSQTPTHQLEDQPPNDTLSISTSER